jgi:hypothetical protein
MAHLLRRHAAHHLPAARLEVTEDRAAFACAGRRPASASCAAAIARAAQTCVPAQCPRNRHGPACFSIPSELSSFLSLRLFWAGGSSRQFPAGGMPSEQWQMQISRAGRSSLHLIQYSTGMYNMT